MIQAFYTASAGIRAQQKNMDVIAHNIANINTPGYRVKRAEFSELLNTIADRQDDVLNTGYGVAVSSISTMPLPGHVNPFGLTIDNDGYFVIENDQGFRSYTKNGNFRPVTQDGVNYFLGTENGEYVLDENFNMIPVSQNPDMFVVHDGQIYNAGQNGEAPIKPAIVRFDDDAQLEVLSGGNVLNTKDSQPHIDTSSRVTVNYSDELSALAADNYLSEMSRMVQTQMAYRINSRVLQTADEMRGMANRLRY
jgi:flagellar basal-body rod protein FlgG